MERKNYLGLGIVLAVFAVVISLMCVCLSYADYGQDVSSQNEINEVSDSANNNENQNLEIANEDIYILRVRVHLRQSELFFDDCLACYYDNSHNLIAQATTISTDDHFATFNLMPKQTNGYVVVYTPDAYCNFAESVKTEDFNDEHILEKDPWVYTQTVSFNADKGLDNFLYHGKYLNMSQSYDEEEFVFYNYKDTFKKLSDQATTGILTIESGGVINIVCLDDSLEKNEELAIIKLTPNYIDGAGFDCWEDSNGKLYYEGDQLKFDPAVGLSGVLHTKEILPPIDINSVSVYGKVLCDDDPISNAEVVLGDRLTGETFATTATDEFGLYSIENVAITNYYERTSGEKESLYVYASAVGSTIDYSKLLSDYKQEGSCAVYTEEDLYLELAKVNLKGSENHNVFQVTLEPYVEGKLYEDGILNFTLTSFGVDEDQLGEEGVDFVISEDGVMSGTRIISGITNDDRTIYIEVKTIANDGYTFDNIDINSKKYYVGDTFNLNGINASECIVYYKPINQNQQISEGGLANTGDGLPYGVIACLGIVAIAAFVIARKQFN